MAIAIGGMAALVTGCATTNTPPTTPAHNNATTQSQKAQSIAVGVSGAQQAVNGSNLTVSVNMSNQGTQASPLQASQFALMISNHAYSPSSSSQIPAQIPAHSNITVTLVFNITGVTGQVTPKLAFQPSGNANEKFVILTPTIIQSEASNPSTQTSSTIHLTTFNDGQNDGIIVDVPVGWKRAPITGGDFGGVKFVNPSDPNQEEILVNSGCVGCYLGANGQANPKLVIPETDVTGTYLLNHGLSVAYSFYKTGNPYPGNGVASVSMNPPNGYNYVEVILPSSEKSVATQILNSFQSTL